MPALKVAKAAEARFKKQKKKTAGGVVHHLGNVIQRESQSGPIAEKGNIRYFYSIARVWNGSQVPGPLPKTFHLPQPDEKQHGTEGEKRAKILAPRKIHPL